MAIVGLHPAHVFRSVRIVADGGVEAGLAVHKFNIRIQLPAHLWRNQRDLLDCFVAAVGALQCGDQTLPCGDAVWM